MAIITITRSRSMSSGYALSATARSTAVSPDPVVSCILLSCGERRAKMKARAVASFESQTYKHKELIVYDGTDGSTIGALRNRANARACGEIIAHWDEDDHSHPNRLAEQVALLQSSGADCVGYNQAVFWREPWEHCCTGSQGPIRGEHPGEAWVYTSMVPKGILGASMLYWRSAWERKPFLDRRTGEDDRWLSGMKVCGVSGLFEPTDEGPSRREPRLIAGVHGGNTTRTNPCEGPREWRRAPELDDFCRGAMKL